MVSFNHRVREIRRQRRAAAALRLMVIGCLYGGNRKAEVYRKTQQYVRAFAEETGSMWCRDLLGLKTWPEDPNPSDRTKQYYDTRPCAGIIEAGGRVLDRLIAAWGLPE